MMESLLDQKSFPVNIDKLNILSFLVDDLDTFGCTVPVAEKEWCDWKVAEELEHRSDNCHPFLAFLDQNGQNRNRKKLRQLLERFFSRGASSLDCIF